MFDVGMFELLLIMIMGLVVLGPERLPEAARMIGAWMSKAKRTMADIKTGVEREVNAHEMRERIKAELAKSGLDDIKEKFEKQEAEFRKKLQSGEFTESSSTNTHKPQTPPQHDFDDEAHHDCSYEEPLDDIDDAHTAEQHSSTKQNGSHTETPDHAESQARAKPLKPTQHRGDDNNASTREKNGSEKPDANPSSRGAS